MIEISAVCARNNTVGCVVLHISSESPDGFPTQEEILEELAENGWEFSDGKTWCPAHAPSASGKLYDLESFRYFDLGRGVHVRRSPKGGAKVEVQLREVPEHEGTYTEEDLSGVRKLSTPPVVYVPEESAKDGDGSQYFSDEMNETYKSLDEALNPDKFCGARSRPGIGGVLGPCVKQPHEDTEWHTDHFHRTWAPSDIDHRAKTE